MRRIRPDFLLASVLATTFAGDAWSGAETDTQKAAPLQQNAGDAVGELCLAKIDLREFSPHSRRADTLDGRKKLRLSLNKGVDVSVDGGSPVHISPTEGGRIAVPLAGRHLIRIRRDNGRVAEESFHFSFESKQTRQLCLWYRAFIYDNWQLDELPFSQRRNRCGHCLIQE